MSKTKVLRPRPTFYVQDHLINYTFNSSDFLSSGSLRVVIVVVKEQGAFTVMSWLTSEGKQELETKVLSPRAATILLLLRTTLYIQEQLSTSQTNVLRSRPTFCHQDQCFSLKTNNLCPRPTFYIQDQLSTSQTNVLCPRPLFFDQDQSSTSKTNILHPRSTFYVQDQLSTSKTNVLRPRPTLYVQDQHFCPRT